MIEVTGAYFGTELINDIPMTTITVQVRGGVIASLAPAISAAEDYAESYTTPEERLWVPLTEDVNPLVVESEMLSVTWYVM